MRRAGSWVIAVFMIISGASALAQVTATFNGRIVDQGDAVLPGATVTATNVRTGVARTTVTNGEGLYSLPALDPGLQTRLWYFLLFLAIFLYCLILR